MEHTHSQGGGSSVADGIARILCIALAAVFPFVVLPLPYAAISQGKLLFIALFFILALVVWMFARLSEGALHIPRSMLLYVSALLPLAYLASSIVSGWSNVSLVGSGIEQDTLAAVTFLAGLLVLTAIAFCGNALGIRLLLQGFSLGLIVLFAYEALYIFFPSLGFGLLSGQTANLLGSWHDLGILAGLAFFLASTSYSSLYAGWKKAIPVVLGVLSLWTLLLVHFSDILYATGILFFLAGLAILRASLGEDHGFVVALKRSLLWLIAALVFGALGYFGQSLWGKLPSPIQITQTEVRPSWQGTFDVAKQSLHAPQEFIFGSGPNSFIKEWGLHKPTGVNQTPFWDSDFNTGVGTIPTSVFTSGVVGLLAWAALILVLLSLLYRFVRERRPLTFSRGLLGATLLGAGYLVGYHMIYVPGLALTAGTFLCLGILAALAAGDAPLRRFAIGVNSVLGGARLFAVVVLALIGIAAAGLMGREVLSNIFVNRAAYVYQTNSDTAAAGKQLSYAFLISPNNDRAHRAAAELGVLELTQLAAQADPNNAESQKQLQATVQETIQHGLSAVSIDSSNYQNWLLLASVYGNLAGVNVEGAYEQAQGAYNKAFEANPSNPTPKYRIAQLAAQKGDYASARQNLADAIKLKPDLAAGYFLLSQVEAADGKGDAAVQAASAAVQLVPDDPLGWFNLGYILYAGGAYNDAAAALQQAVQRAPDYSNALYYLGLSAYQLKQTETAAQIFDRIAQLNPSETWIAQVAANIRAKKDPFQGVQNNQ